MKPLDVSDQQKDIPYVSWVNHLSTESLYGTTALYTCTYMYAGKDSQLFKGFVIFLVCFDTNVIETN